MRTPLARNRIAASELILLTNTTTGCFLTNSKFKALGGNNPMASTSDCGAEITMIILTFLLRLASSRVPVKKNKWNSILMEGKTQGTGVSDLTKVNVIFL